MVDTAAVGIPAFRFLDIRSPRQASGELTKYVITRASLDFPETAFEAALKRANSGNESEYIPLLTKATDAVVTADFSSMPTGGYLDRRREYEQLLTAKQMSPEAVYSTLKDFYLADKDALPDSEYLFAPIASTWDGVSRQSSKGHLARKWIRICWVSLHLLFVLLQSSLLCSHRRTASLIYAHFRLHLSIFLVNYLT